MLNNLFHYFLPHRENNYRAKLLHHSSLMVVITFLLFGSFFVSTFRNNLASVLGDSIDMSVQKLLLLTNQKRAENGLPPLALNSQLTNAAVKKADNMFSQNYWAHNAPDGKTPWTFIKAAGYNYVYAGENLARGFNNADEVVNAWMESPKHKENLLSVNYRDVGFAVENGKLSGETTILVVGELGSQTLEPVSTKTPVEQNINVVINSNTGNNLVKKPFASVLSFSTNLDRTLLVFFIFTLFLDMLIIERQKIIRFVGHNIDHILFLIIILLFIGLLSKGVII